MYLFFWTMWISSLRPFYTGIFSTHFLILPGLVATQDRFFVWGMVQMQGNNPKLWSTCNISAGVMSANIILAKESCDQFKHQWQGEIHFYYSSERSCKNTQKREDIWFCNSENMNEELETIICPRVFLPVVCIYHIIFRWKPSSLSYSAEKCLSNPQSCHKFPVSLKLPRLLPVEYCKRSIT